MATQEKQIRAWIEKKPDLTLAELCERLREEKAIELKEADLWHQLDKWGFSLKKTLHASGQEREDVRMACEKWHQDQAALEGGKLVFLDETGVTTNLTRRYGRSQKGTRCVDKAPHGHWQTSTFIAALRVDGISAPWLLDGPAFLEYVRQVLAPTLAPGDVVIADNLSSHKVAGVREAIEARGASLLFLPAYSPDLNPIENFFAKLKALLRKTAQRNFDGLLLHIALILDSLSTRECSILLPLSRLWYFLNQKCSRNRSRLIPNYSPRTFCCYFSKLLRFR